MKIRTHLWFVRLLSKQQEGDKMWNRSRAVPFGIATLSVWLLATSVLSTGAPAGRTGAPGDLTCADGGCHPTNPLNSGDGQVTVEGPSSYQGGTPVELVVRASRPGAARFGFQITVRNTSGAMAGSWEVTEGTQLADFGLAVAYLTHAALAPRATDTYSWTVKWIPPAVGEGDVTFYAAANTANGDDTFFNDFIYTTSFQMADAGSTAVQDLNIPSTIELGSAYPNPTSGAFTVSFDLSEPSHVALFLYDGLGRIRVQTESNFLSSGNQHLSVPATNLAPGIYSYRLTASGHSKMGTITVLR